MSELRVRHAALMEAQGLVYWLHPEATDQDLRALIGMESMGREDAETQRTEKGFVPHKPWARKNGYVPAARPWAR
jgi:hypothetical protein